MNDQTLAADLLRGASAIADFLGFERRVVYHAISAGHLPTFKMGATICARKSSLLRWIEEQERAAA